MTRAEAKQKIQDILAEATETEDPVCYVTSEDAEALEAAIEALEQPERAGHWVGIDDEPCEVFECDICGKPYETCGYTWDLPNYCPNCGAKMEVEE